MPNATGSAPDIPIASDSPQLLHGLLVFSLRPSPPLLWLSLMRRPEDQRRSLCSLRTVFCVFAEGFNPLRGEARRRLRRRRHQRRHWYWVPDGCIARHRGRIADLTPRASLASLRPAVPPVAPEKVPRAKPSLLGGTRRLGFRRSATASRRLPPRRRTPVCLYECMQTGDTQHDVMGEARSSPRRQAQSLHFSKSHSEKMQYPALSSPDPRLDSA
jgi:hypothetical protein